jgi:hypothetical protein
VLPMSYQRKVVFFYFLCFPCRIRGKLAVCFPQNLLFFVFFSNRQTPWP